VQVRALPLERVVRQLVHLDVQVAGGAAAGADLALAGQPNPHAVGHAGRDLHRDRAAGPDAAVARALLARVRDHLAVAAAHRARASRDHLAEERALHRLDLPAAVAGVTLLRLRAGGAAATLALVAQHAVSTVISRLTP